MNDHTTRHILEDEVGPLITEYLETRFDLIDTLNQMTPTSAGAFIEAHIKPEAMKLKPKQSEAPPPAEALNGNGAPQQKHPALEGVVYS
jgi:hypothetical protein